MRFARFRIAILLVSCLASACSAADRMAAVSGTVKGATGVPIVVRLVPVTDDPTRYYDGYEVKAADDGTFLFRDIHPGDYRVTAQATGFVAEPGRPGPIVTLRPHKTLRGVVVILVAWPPLCGRVTENGNPKKTWVTAFRYDRNRGTFLKTFLSSTNQDGSYCFADLAPGTYFVEAYTTWYPGSYTFSGAKPITLEYGQPRIAVDIPLQSTGCRSIQVSGHILAPSVDQGAQFRVNFMQRNPESASMPTFSFTNDGTLYRAGDDFTARLCPGDYDVALSDPRAVRGDGRETPSSEVIFDVQHVDAQAGSVEGVSLTAHPMASISGQVHFESITPRASCPTLGGQKVSIQGPQGQSQAANVDDKGRFDFRYVAPGEYSLSLGPYLREAVYVKSITVDGVPVEGRRISILKPAPMTVDVVLSGDRAHAAGHIPPDLPQQQRWEVAWTRPKGSLAGQVLGDGDRSGFIVKLRSARYNSPTSEEYVSAPAPDGSFRFDPVDPGVYTLRVENKGFLPAEYGAQAMSDRGAPIVVARAAHVTGLKLLPTRLSSVCGRITDISGAPQPGLRIFMLPTEGFKRTYFPAGEQPRETKTDELGRFRMDQLRPGDYFPELLSGRAAFFSADGSLDQAAPVHLSAGEDIGCAGQPLELHLPPALHAAYSVSGKVSGDLPPAVGDRFWVTLAWDVPGQHAGVAYAKVDAERQFRLEHVPNGRFLLELHSAYGPERMGWSGPYPPSGHLLASQPVEVKGGDLHDLVIAPITLPRVTGTVRFSHVPTEWKAFQVSGHFISLVAREYRAPASAKLSPDGSFQFAPVDVGDYEVKAGLEPPMYIRSVTVNGQKVEQRTIHLAAGAAVVIEVEVADDAGKVTATVTPDPSLPLSEPNITESCQKPAGPGYQFVLFPDPLPPLKNGGFLQAMLVTGYYAGGADHAVVQAGTVPPGNYRALVAEHLWKAIGVSVWHDPGPETQALWESLAALAQPVTVHPGEKLDVVLPDRTVDVARVAARFHLPLDTDPLP